MKTFEEIKNDIIAFNSRLLDESYEKLRQPDLDEYDKIATKKTINICQDNLDNIDEVTTIFIGSEINHLIEFIQYAYTRDGSDYFEHFDQFMDKWILGEYDNKGERKPGPAATGYIHSIGITREDLQSLKGTVPIRREFGDELRQRANDVIGLNIPMAGEEDKALSEFENAGEDNKEQAYVTLKEMQRNSGSLRNGPNYYMLLANDQRYQMAKSNDSEKIL